MVSNQVVSSTTNKKLSAKETDEQLIAAYINGNNNAFDRLLKRYESKVFTYILYSVQDEELAQDLFQDCFIKIITKLQSGQYTENGKFASWVMRIAHNLVIDHHRQRQNTQLLSNDESDVDLFNNASIAVDDNREREMIDTQTMNEVKALIRLLPESQREVVLMRFYKDMSFKEIAEVTNVSINTALGRMRYALINMRKLAKQYDISLAV
ncbi:MAG: sigma-70 family RNA polymerase sigma factor [Bacteroidaceae bacterium]|nr:sigma-70 family RNA polymerase sigma factor [Bacteroidaceae bacterium]MDO4994028.1 sigma-70 family RNA polymerase sigma factor [Bacteroidales bacterium]